MKAGICDRFVILCESEETYPGTMPLTVEEAGIGTTAFVNDRPPINTP